MCSVKTNLKFAPMMCFISYLQLSSLHGYDFHKWGPNCDSTVLQTCLSIVTESPQASSGYGLIFNTSLGLQTSNSVSIIFNKSNIKNIKKTDHSLLLTRDILHLAKDVYSTKHIIHLCWSQNEWLNWLKYY